MFKNYEYDSKPEKYSFDIENIDLSIVNGIRRTILTDIPVVGFIGENDPTIEIINSNGPLHNEFLIHRIGLIPLYISEEETENYDDNDLEFELAEQNDINFKYIYTNMIYGKRKDKDLTKKELEKIFPANKITNSHILITKLRNNEYLHFKAKAVKKTARYNASFSPVSLCNFYYNQDNTLITKDTKILDKERLYLKNKYGDPISFKFELEIINDFSLKYIFSKAINIIIDKLINIKKNLENSIIKIEQFQDLPNTYNFYIDDEDDTVGNIIQSIIHNNHIRQNKDICKYIGYICPHPLKQLLIIRLTLENKTDKSIFINYLDKNISNIIDELHKIDEEWNKFILKV
jgi:DNA-directed RNA polymerase alpha subunit